MSLRSQIRAALVGGPLSVDELLPLLPAFKGNRARLAAHMNVLEIDGKVRRCNQHDLGQPVYQLEPSIWPDEKTAEANQTQVGGNHYRALTPQPWDVIVAWDLDFLAGNVVKYVARAGRKGNRATRLEDLRKALHYIEKLIENEIADDPDDRDGV